MHHQADEVFGKLRACCGRTLQLELSLHRFAPSQASNDFLWYGHDNGEPWINNPLVDTQNPGGSPPIVTETAIFFGTLW